jgi:23S rRNA pseudouridine2457 synthase
MTAAVGFATLRLVRVRIGNINIDGMITGDVATLTNFDSTLNR